MVGRKMTPVRGTPLFLPPYIHIVYVVERPRDGVEKIRRDQRSVFGEARLPEPSNATN